MKKKKSKPNTFTETFTVRPEQGMATFAAAISKVGYKMIRLERSGTSATITYQAINPS